MSVKFLKDIGHGFTEGAMASKTAKYAHNTKVPPERSAEEVKHILRKYQATSIGTMETSDGIVILAQLRNRNLRFSVEKQRDPKEYMRRWRVLVLRVKAALEEIADDKSQAGFDEHMMSWILLPSGQTVAEFARVGVAHAYENGAMPNLSIEYRP